MTDARTAVYAIMRARGARIEEHADHSPIGAGGLGLDSIAIAEVLLDCERSFQRAFTDLLDGAPITVERLVARAEQSITS